MNKVTLTDEQLSNLIKIAGLDIDAQDATNDTVSHALIEIERKLNFFNYPVSFFTAENLNVLIADDMELSIYQLTSMLKKIGSNVCVARTKDEAIAEIKKKKFDYIIVDLFIPDANDGFELIEFANKIKEEKGSDFKIVAVSGTDDNSLIQKSYSMGIDEFVSKQPNWHQNIMKFISSTVTKTANDEYQKYYINDNICVLSIHKINSELYISNILKEVSASVLTGKPHIIFDMENIKFFATKFSYVFAQVYKTAKQGGGSFVIVKPSKDVTDALGFVFLNNAIRTFQSIEDAIKEIELTNN